MEERRNQTVENILLEIGSLKEISKHTRNELIRLNEHISVQNNRVGRLEQHRSFTNGVVAFLVVFFIPIAVKVLSEWIIK